MNMEASPEEIKQLLMAKPFKKLTGPPEHWLTTFNTNFGDSPHPTENNGKLFLPVTYLFFMQVVKQSILITMPI